MFTSPSGVFIVENTRGRGKRLLGENVNCLKIGALSTQITCKKNCLPHLCTLGKKYGGGLLKCIPLYIHIYVLWYGKTSLIYSTLKRLFSFKVSTTIQVHFFLQDSYTRRDGRWNCGPNLLVKSNFWIYKFDVRVFLHGTRTNSYSSTLTNQK